MNILNDPWVPVFTDGKITRLTLDQSRAVPLGKIDAGRPELTFITFVLAIGLKQTGFVPDGVFDDVRFMQDHDAKNGKKNPIQLLLIDGPSMNAIKNNKDFFVKRGSVTGICPHCAMLAMYANSQLCGPGGAGYFPGHLYHNALYIIAKSTFGETVDANILLDGKISSSAWFSAPKKYWLCQPSIHGECDICGSDSALVTHYYQKTKKNDGTQNDPNTLAARTKNNKRYAIDQHNTALDIVDGCANDSLSVISPLVISENASIGDAVIGFGTAYEKASLKRYFYHSFAVRNTFDFQLINYTSRKFWQFRYGENRDYDDKSSDIIAFKMSIADLVLQGIAGIDACMTVYDSYIPNDDGVVLRKLNSWIACRRKIMNFYECRELVNL